MSYSKSIKKEIKSICKRLYKRNMLAAADGNVSFRISDDEILITPSGLAKAFIDEDDIATININDEILSGNPSAERKMHLAVYRHCPQAKAVVHAHPPTCIAWSIASPEDKELPANSLPEVILATGRIPIVPYARPTTDAMGEVLLPYLPESKVMILSRHGGLSWGESLQEAFYGMERMEHSAQILKLAKELGGLSELPEIELSELYKMRQSIGHKNL